MGVKGLYQFMEKYFPWGERRPLTGKLVIDALSLCRFLDNKHDIDWTHGGQYAELRDATVNFVQSLKNSEVTPIFVFDGVNYDKDVKKLKMKRRKQAIESINSVLYGPQHTEQDVKNAHSILSTEVYIQALRECRGECQGELDLLVVDGEADPKVVALANHYKCPVLARDSDYYLYNVEYGYIPLEKLHLNEH